MPDLPGKSADNDSDGRPPAASSEPSAPPSGGSGADEEARDRRAANLFLLTMGAVLVGVGIWLGNALVDARRADECMATGRRNCAPIDIKR